MYCHSLPHRVACCVSFSPDGKLAGAYNTLEGDGGVLLWNTDQRPSPRSHSVPRGIVFCVNFSPDGKSPLQDTQAIESGVVLWNGGDRSARGANPSSPDDPSLSL